MKRVAVALLALVVLGAGAALVSPSPPTTAGDRTDDRLSALETRVAALETAVAADAAPASTADVGFFVGTWDTSIVADAFVPGSGDTGAAPRAEEAGFLRIDGDGAYTWKVYPSDPREDYVRGRWRAATPDELAPGGEPVGIVLLAGHDGVDWIVTRDDAGRRGEDWVRISWLSARSISWFGVRRPAD